jgi:hypothetical protein
VDARRIVTAAAVVVAVVLLAAGTATWLESPATEATSSSRAVSPLTVVEVPAPPIRVPRIETTARYPQVRGANVDLRAVNAALRDLVVGDERAFTTYAREERTDLEGVGDANGPSWAYFVAPYRVQVDPKLVSASTTVVSALLPAEREVFPGQSGGDQWLSITVLPSGRRLKIWQLFADPERGLRVFAKAWRARLGRRAACTDYSGPFNVFRYFALTPTGLAVGGSTSGACSRWVATVPYRILRPHLSELGAKLISGVRRPRLVPTKQATGPAAVVFVQALPGGFELTPHVRKRVPAARGVGFGVTVAAEGARRSRTRVTLTLRQARSTIKRTATIASIAAGQEKSVVFSNLGPLEFGSPASVKIDISPWGSSSAREEDSAVYPIAFARAEHRQEGARGIALVAMKALPAKQTLWPRIENAVAAHRDLGFAATIKNTGQATERNVKVTLYVDLEDSRFTQTMMVRLIEAGQTRTAVFRSPGHNAFAAARIVWVAITPVPGERNRWNNGTSYPVTLSRR